MPESKMTKLKESLMKTQTAIAKVLGTRRIGALKTEKMPEKMIAGYETSCKKFAKWAETAQAIENAAIEGKIKKIARNARNCKVDIKSCFEKYTKDVTKTSDNPQLADAKKVTDNASLREAESKILNLLAMLNDAIVYMQKIHKEYSDAIEKLKQENPEYQSAPPPVPPRQ